MSMTLISHQELASAAASITFSSIPATFTDLYLVLSARSDRAAGVGDDIKIDLNTSGSDFTNRTLFGDGSSASTFSTTNNAGFISASLATANSFGNTSIYIPNYTSTVAKSISTDSVFESNASGVTLGIAATYWNPSTQAAINEIKLYPRIGANFVQYSSATLFGIIAGSDGIVAVS
jgi:hypothetical protein